MCVKGTFPEVAHKGVETAGGRQTPPLLERRPPGLISWVCCKWRLPTTSLGTGMESRGGFLSACFLKPTGSFAEAARQARRVAKGRSNTAAAGLEEEVVDRLPWLSPHLLSVSKTGPQPGRLQVVSSPSQVLQATALRLLHGWPGPARWATKSPVEGSWREPVWPPCQLTEALLEKLALESGTGE